LERDREEQEEEEAGAEVGTWEEWLGGKEVGALLVGCGIVGEEEWATGTDVWYVEAAAEVGAGMLMEEGLGWWMEHEAGARAVFEEGMAERVRAAIAARLTDPALW